MVLSGGALPVEREPQGFWRLAAARSGIDGVGTFALEDIPAGVFVLECRGIVLQTHEVTEDMRVMQIGPDLYLAEDPDDPNVDDFLNHSCEPNVGFSNGSLALYSLRDIKSGEELFFDYSTSMNEPGWAMRCRCGAPSCRGVIRSFCDLSQSERRRLEPTALAYLRGQ